jgi:cell fate regulator YaaT (PSP1 superfamily)
MHNHRHGAHPRGSAPPDPAQQREKAASERRKREAPTDGGERTRTPANLAEQMVAPSLRVREPVCTLVNEGAIDTCASAGCSSDSIDQHIFNDFPYADGRRIVEVVYKGNRREFVLVEDPELMLRVHDYVIVEGERGVDIGTVSMSGSLVHAKRKAKRLADDPLPRVVRTATSQDMETHRRDAEAERKALTVCRHRVEHFGLPMNLVGSEWQFDHRRITFYFTADGRVDFRELVRDLASIFHTRIELRQIAVRDEARRLGGMGICGRVLCCTSHLGRYEHVTLDHAKAQHLQVNPTKLSGVCGRLKCCLLYELDTYVEALQRFPALESAVHTPNGEALVQKIDIFRDLIYLYNPVSHETETLTLPELTTLLSARTHGRRFAASTEIPGGQ